ncbi:Pectin lyase-like superfamily protein [Perilla frutescens var. hirtella]|uniref:Pectin lyase-like superfamily protein n=1 Tax=Perilla frutescens var. hirtella TaxID=608512 RepID=A0AAD4IPR3_PERFH|nr:Pectin lyase-like superfamily protein [Perilla frutescens var. hirtella]
MMIMKSSYTIIVPIFVFLLSLHLKETQCSTRHSKLDEFQTKLQRLVTSNNLAKPAQTTPSPTSPKSNGRVFYPIGYGADPTGAQDSSAAILAALNDAIKLKNGLNLLPGISDLGGAVIDLQGGSFVISSPIRFPPDIGNIVVQGGSLRASNTFPGDRHLIELWAPDSQNAALHRNFSDMKDLNNGMKYEDVTLKDLLLDSTYRGGGLLVVDSARIRVSNCFFLHFTTQGIMVQRGHETFISACFLGQHPTVGGDSDEKGYSATAIDIASTDNAVTDVVIFSAAIGISLRGRANIVTGVHCYNKATFFGGVGILVKSAQNRIVDSYLDFNSIVVEDPDQVVIANGFFLGDGNIVLKSIQGQISGLNIVNNIFSGEPKNNVPCVKLDGQFKSIDQVVIEHNVVSGMSLKSTAANLNVQANGTKWEADFSPILLFPNQITHLQYSFYMRGGGIAAGFPAHAVTSVSNNVVVIESQQPVNAVVSVSVDQHNMAGEGTL